MTHVINLRRKRGQPPARLGVDYDALVDRRTKWGNRFEMGEPHPVTGRPMTRTDVVALHREEVLADPALCAAIVRELRDKRLACWCWPDPCHADTLAAIADGRL